MDIKTIPQVYLDAYDRGDFDTLGSLVDENIKISGTFPGEHLQGKPALWEHFKAFKEGMPDGKHKVLEVIAEGEWVAAHFRFEGTHTGTFMGIPATNKSTDIGGMGMLHIVDGKVVEEIAYFDTMLMMQQLGLAPKM